MARYAHTPTHILVLPGQCHCGEEPPLFLLLNLTFGMERVLRAKIFLCRSFHSAQTLPTYHNIISLYFRWSLPCTPLYYLHLLPMEIPNNFLPKSLPGFRSVLPSAIQSRFSLVMVMTKQMFSPIGVFKCFQF